MSRHLPRHRPLGFLLLLTLVAWAATMSAVATAGERDVSFTPTGLLQYDLVDVDSDGQQARDDHRARLARLGFKLGQSKRWQLAVEHEFTARSTPDAYLQVHFDDSRYLKLGQFKQPFMLESAISARQTPLMEASLTGSLAIGRRIGAAYIHAAEDATVEAALFGQRLDGRNEGVGAAVRGTRVVARQTAGLLHVGAGGSVDYPDSGLVRFSSKPGSALAALTLVDTGHMDGAHRVVRTGVEGLWIHRSLSLQAELVRVGVDLREGIDFTGHGNYALVSWSPSGHHRGYRAGVAGAPDLDGGSAWELFLRRSHLDLDDGGIQGGTQSDWAFGATWYLNPHVHLMANYILVDSERAGVVDRPRLAQVRAQFAF